MSIPRTIIDELGLQQDEEQLLWEKEFAEMERRVLTLPERIRAVDLVPELLNPSPYIAEAKDDLVVFGEKALNAVTSDMERAFQECEEDLPLSRKHAVFCGHTATTYAFAVALSAVSEPLASLTQAYSTPAPKILTKIFTSLTHRARTTKEAESSDLERLFLEAKYREIYLRARTFMVSTLTALFLGAKEPLALSAGRRAIAPLSLEEKETGKKLLPYPPRYSDMKTALTLFYLRGEEPPFPHT